MLDGARVDMHSDVLNTPKMRLSLPQLQDFVFELELQAARRPGSC